VSWVTNEPCRCQETWNRKRKYKAWLTGVNFFARFIRVIFASSFVVLDSSAKSFRKEKFEIW
jgi:hypothetical protein